MKMKTTEEKTYQATMSDLRNQDLRHYEKLSNKALHWSSGIPRAINFFYDYQQMSIWERIMLSFKYKSKQN